ncbi:MAG: hypothetical protein HY791_13010 [Deltaproteobacteria bacterium]|nr:hypothetical protein [Deltaproteobacteria bacterium]
MTDLWGDIPSVSARTPVDVLREQASLLKQKTFGKLTGFVTQPASSDHGKISATLGVQSPALDDYSVALIRITYPAELYPVEVDNLLERGRRPRAIFEPSDSVASSEGEFLDVLRNIFASDRVRQVLSGLLAHGA